MKNKAALFKGLSATFVSITSIAAFISALAFQRTGDINLALGIKVNEAEITDNTNFYPSQYSSKEEMLEAEKDFIIQSEEEGCVLLRNENNALPLQSNAKVTLLGNASVNHVYHGASGGPTNTGTNLYTALKESGFEINDKVYSKTEANGKSQSDGDLGEVDASIYSSSDFEGYKDAAIIVFARYGGEANDLDLVDNDGVAELSFHEKEKAIVELAKSSGFDKIIVLLNSGYPQDLGWLKEYNIDACLWIGNPGLYGMYGVANVLKGEASPSGRTVDTFASNSLSSPAMQNYGDFEFINLKTNGMYHKEYVVYAEGIYTGYRYYETRYADSIINPSSNASSSIGAYASSSSWEYKNEVVFPFGYGLTYSTFTQELKSLTWEDHEVKAKVTVTNTGSFACKEVVQLYVSLPYSDGNAQKSAIQLLDFSKTKTLNPGESEDIEISVSDYLFATYDTTATNGKDTSKKGCYIFDKGDYTFAIGSSSHDALNNVLAINGYTGMCDTDGNVVTGEASKAKVISLEEYDNTTYATSPTTGEIISNQFDDVDYNYYVDDAINYLNRSNWETFPKTYDSLDSSLDTSGYITKVMSATSSLYETPDDAPDYKNFKYAQEVTKKFIEMKDVELEGTETWDAFIDQLTLDELSNIPAEKMAVDAISSIGFPESQNGDGPDGIQNGGTLHVAEVLACATYNKDLIKQRGRFLAEDAYYNKKTMVYGGGANLHRHPYNGRNFEYFSEDPTLSYFAGKYEGEGMSEGGLIGAFKHFLANDQEVNRHGVATFMSEQNLRQSTARAFEGALTKGSARANMSSFNRIGVTPTASSYALMTQLLRKEWGFDGISITDSSKDASSYIFTADSLAAGTNMFNNDSARQTEVKNLMVKNRDGYIWSKVRETAKYSFYTYSRSKLINGLTLDTEVSSSTPWWQTAIIALDSSLGALALLSIGGYVFFNYFFKSKKEVKENA